MNRPEALNRSLVLKVFKSFGFGDPRKKPPASERKLEKKRSSLGHLPSRSGKSETRF